MHLKYLTICFVATIFIFVVSCKKDIEPNSSIPEFILQDGFDIKLIAEEPLLDSPVAMQFDKKGRIWVVEMTGYMRDIDGSDEDLPDGKIVILTDENGDGQMDKRTVFLDGLLAPRTLMFAYNGLLYSDGTYLMWTSIENDQPSNKVLVDSLYVIGGNIEHQSNGLLYHLDNWIYSSKSNARYRLKNGEWIKEATTFRGQWGITHDDVGRLFANENSIAFLGDYIMPNVLIENPYQKIKHGLQIKIAKNRRVYPIQPTAVNRGYEENVLDEEGKVRKLTSACGPLVYLGDQFPEEYYGNGFVCAPEANLIKRYLIDYNKINLPAEQAYNEEEFLISTDETFRPVNLYTGLDGAMYIVDLRKGIIQHRAYMTSYLREKILEKGLEKITGIGRIYKVYFNESENPDLNKKTPDFSAYKPIEYLPLLNHKNGELRMLAQREIVFSKERSLKNDLVKLAIDKDNPLGQIHTLWSLEGLGMLDASTLSQAVKVIENQDVVAQIIRLAALTPGYDNALKPIFEKGILKDKGQTDLYLCHISGKMKNETGIKIWQELADYYSNDPIFCEALISGISDREDFFINKINHLKKDSIYSMLSQVILNKKNNEIKAPQLYTEPFLDNRTAGFKYYNTYCLSCHGHDGKGNENLAPPLYPSEYVTGPPERMIAIALQGLKGPVTVNGKKYNMNLVMPGIKNNPDLTDKKIADLIVFIRNSFASQELGFPAPIDETIVRDIRKKLEGSEEMFTEESLKNWMKVNVPVK